MSSTAYLTRQLERWTRPNAHLFVRPDWRRFVPRDQDDHPFALYENKYRPDQPRVPAGNPDGGQWTADGGSRSPGSQPTIKPPPINDPRVISDAVPDNDWKPGAQYAQNNTRQPEEWGRVTASNKGKGHHFVPNAVSEELQISDEARRVFDKARTGPLNDPSANWYDNEHRQYNRAVREELKTYIDKNNIESGRMTEAQARDFIKELHKSKNSAIRSFNLRAVRRHLRFLLLRIGRE